MAKKNRETEEQAAHQAAHQAADQAADQDQDTDLTTTSGAMDIFEGFSDEEIADLQETTGLEETERNRRPPYYVFNQDMVDDQGNDVKPDNFYNCQTGEQKTSIRCALLGLKETRDFSYYNKDTGMKIRVCRSFDMQIGQWTQKEEIELRECAKCPHRLAKPGVKKACTIVRKIAAYDLDEDEVFVFDSKRSSFVPMGNYFERNFFGKIKRGSKRFDIPLYMMETTLTLKSEMGKLNKRYYVLDPKITGKVGQKEKILHLKSLADQVKRYGKDEYDDIQSKPPASSDELDTDYTPEAGAKDDDDDIPF